MAQFAASFRQAGRVFIARRASADVLKDMIKLRHLATIMSILGMFAVFALPGPGWAADEFFSALPDLPVMPELVENRDAAVIFDKPEGRIVTLAAMGRVSREAVSQYYERALPQLGWTKTGPGRFQRDGEILNLKFFAKGKDLEVRISLLPE
jgi:hypothetical protein